MTIWGMSAKQYTGSIVNLQIGRRIYYKIHNDKAMPLFGVVQANPKEKDLRMIKELFTITQHDIEHGSIWEYIPGACKNCSPFHGIIRQKDGEWKSCTVCYGIF